jgi:hypothetical protein
MPFNVELLGGEPSVHPDIINIITELNGIDNCVQVELTSNLAKPLSFFKKLNIADCNKLDIVASYHPEYFSDKFSDKIIEINKYDHIGIFPLINLPDDKKYWDMTLRLIDTLIDNDVSIALNLLYNYEGMEWAPGYTDEFWKTFSSWVNRDVIDDASQLTGGEEVLDSTRIEKAFASDMTGNNADNWRNRNLKSFSPRPGPIIANRGRWFKTDDSSIMLTDSDVYKNALYKYKGWKCRPLMWMINMDGSIVNHCTHEPVSVLNMKKENLTKCVTCPLENCDCNTKYQYVKKRV